MERNKKQKYMSYHTMQQPKPCTCSSGNDERICCKRGCKQNKRRLEVFKNMLPDGEFIAMTSDKVGKMCRYMLKTIPK